MVGVEVLRHGVGVEVFGTEVESLVVGVGKLRHGIGVEVFGSEVG